MVCVEWWVVVGGGVGGVGKGLNDSSAVFQLNKEYVIGLKQEPFDTNDDGGREGRTDRVKFRDANWR